jgi:hypothetical protein
VLRLTSCGHVDNASALPTGSTAHNSRHRRLLLHQLEARKPEFPPQFGRTRSRIVSETPTDSSEEAILKDGVGVVRAFIGTQSRVIVRPGEHHDLGDHCLLIAKDQAELLQEFRPEPMLVFFRACRAVGK